jgi:hypothetical protein
MNKYAVQELKISETTNVLVRSYLMVLLLCRVTTRPYENTFDLETQYYKTGRQKYLMMVIWKTEGNKSIKYYHMFLKMNST